MRIPRLALVLSLALAAAGASGSPFTFTGIGPLNTARVQHTLTLLGNGKVLAVGGLSFGNQLASTELFDPASGTWTATGSLNAARYFHSATLLPTGKVLVAGGYGLAGNLTSAELYDPATGTWTATGSMSGARSSFTATVLANGNVLVAGGFSDSGSVASAEIYQTLTGTWTPVGPLATARHIHTATLLPDGTVLVAGGLSSFTFMSVGSTEVFDPATGMWSLAGPLGNPRTDHTATLLPTGKVLVAAGSDFGAISSAELYDPATRTWSPAASLAAARDAHAAALLPNGKLLVIGGYDENPDSLASAEIYDPATNAWTATGSLVAGRDSCPAVTLPSGQVLVAGGFGGKGTNASAELFDPANGSVTATTSLATPRYRHTLTLLPSGKALLVGGIGGASAPLYVDDSEVYDPAAGTWTTVPIDFAGSRVNHTVTVLPDGRVLIAGGSRNPARPTAAIIDSTTLVGTVTGALNTDRLQHTATLLRDGRVMVTGGTVQGGSGEILTSVEFYNPSTGAWTVSASSLPTPRYAHSATLLLDGRVLVAGGVSPTGSTAATYLYSPATGIWSPGPSMIDGRTSHLATLLPGGRVLVTGGSINYSEIFDPATSTWTRSITLPNQFPLEFPYTSTLLPDGRVLAGSFIYDPAIRRWTTVGSFEPGEQTAATLLADGTVLVAGGYTYASPLPYTSASRRFDPGLGFGAANRPLISTAAGPSGQNSALVLGGSRFRGPAGASSGNGQDASAAFPVVQLRALTSGLSLFLPSDPAQPWSATSFVSTLVRNFPPGPALATVFVGGVPSPSVFVQIGARVASANPSLQSVTFERGGLRVRWLDRNPGNAYRVEWSADLTGSWQSFAGSVTASGTGVIDILDPAAAAGQRFYRLVAL